MKKYGIKQSIQYQKEKENINSMNITKTQTNQNIYDVTYKKFNEQMKKEEKEKEEEKKLTTFNQTNLLPFTNPSSTAKNINDQKIYLDKETGITFRDYGQNLYQYSYVLEQESIPGNFVFKTKIIPDIRTKMVDWLIEVLSVYKCCKDTFFLSIFIMDLFIWKNSNTSVMTIEEIHLLGMTSLFIASKKLDVIPIRMQSMISKIGHNSFSENQICLKERLILKTIGYECLIATSSYEFINTYFYDLKFNNEEQIKKFKIETIIDQFKECCIYFAMMIAHFECFYSYKISQNALSCILIAFDLMRSNVKSFTKPVEEFLRFWIMFLIKESSCNTSILDEIYNKMLDVNEKYEKIYFISHNLKKYYPLNLYENN